MHSYAKCHRQPLPLYFPCHKHHLLRLHSSHCSTATAAMYHRRSHPVFDHVLHQYLVDKGLRVTAEVYRLETGVRLSPFSPSEIDVPQRDPLWWWLVNTEVNDLERETLPHNDGSSNRDYPCHSFQDEGNMSEQSGLSQSGLPELVERLIDELGLDDISGLNHGHNLVSETVPNLESLGSPSAPPNQDRTHNQELYYAAQAFPRTRTIASNENCGKMIKPGDSEDASIFMPDGNHSHSVTCFPAPLYLKKSPKFSFFHATHVGDGKGFSCSQDDKVKPYASLLKEKKYEEGSLYVRDEKFKFSSYFMGEKEDNKEAFTTGLGEIYGGSLSLGEEKMKLFEDCRDGSIEVPSSNPSHWKTWSLFPVDRKDDEDDEGNSASIKAFHSNCRTT